MPGLPRPGDGASRAARVVLGLLIVLTLVAAALVLTRSVILSQTPGAGGDHSLSNGDVAFAGYVFAAGLALVALLTFAALRLVASPRPSPAALLTVVMAAATLVFAIGIFLVVAAPALGRLPLLSRRIDVGSSWGTPLTILPFISLGAAFVVSMRRFARLLAEHVARRDGDDRSGE